MASRSHPIIIFLDRNGFLLYQDFFPNVWQFPFSEDLVRHLEVINEDKLVDAILSFVKTNKLTPTSIIVILWESVVFQKELGPLEPGQAPEGEARRREIQQFLENVPFEYFMAKVVGNTRIVATNKELVEAIVLPFKKIGCSLEAVVPSFVYDGKIDFSQGISADIAKAILRDPDLLRMGNMLIGQKDIETKKELEQRGGHADSSKEKPKNKRQIVLIIVFIFLSFVLAIVYFAMGRSSSTPVSSNTNSSQAPRIPVSGLTPTVVLEPTNIIASPSAVSLGEIKTTIVVNSQTQAVGNILKRTLEDLGLENAEVSLSDSANPARSSLVFSEAVGNEERGIIAEEVRKILPDVSVSQSQSLENLSISIVVGSAL